MLEEHNVEFTYREYTKDPLSEDEIRDILTKLNLHPKAILRTREAKKRGIDSEEPAERLISEMALNPKLIQRPIALWDKDACLARPAETLLEWL